MGSIKEFLVGKSKDAPSVGDMAKDTADKTLKNKLVKNPFNHWAFVLFRRYFLYPLLKLPLVPLVIVLDIRQKFQSFKLALGVLRETGRKIQTTTEPPKEVQGLRRFIKKVGAVLGKPFGNPIAAELSFSEKLFVFTLVLWLLSILLIIGGFIHGFSSTGKTDFLIALSKLTRDLSPLSPLTVGSVAYGLVFGGCVLWLKSAFLALALRAREWVTTTEKISEFLPSTSLMPKGDDGRVTAIGNKDFVFLSGQSVALGKVRMVQTGWPGNFLPGEIFENPKEPTHVLALRRPEKEPIVFGGEFSRSDIASRYDLYKSKLLDKTTGDMKKPQDPESLLLGEVIDSKWWRSNAIFTELSNNPHAVVVGQTRSGKTKSVLSFVYTFAAAFPDTIWYFADGKSSPDYSPFADHLSTFPVAFPDSNGSDPLINFANVIEDVWNKFLERRQLFDKAKAQGKSCSTIYQYRQFVGPMPQIWLIMDEFGVFNMELEFDKNYKTDGTLANRLKRLTAEAASFGIHLLFASQRYQNTDVPTTIRSNLTIRMVHNVQMSDANFLETPEATTLSAGQFILTAAGLFCEHTGLNKVKCKLPYIGDNPMDLVKRTLKEFPKEQKKEFDPYLIYNKGGDDVADMNVPNFCARLHRYFGDQQFTSESLAPDLEAVDIQMEVRKGEKVTEKHSDGSVSTKIVPYENSPRIGIAVMRPDEVDEESIESIQKRYTEYSAIIIFLLGKSGAGSKYKFLQTINEQTGARFALIPFKEYSKDFKMCEMMRRQGKVVDLVSPKIEKLGIADVSHTVAADSLDAESIMGAKSPVKLKLAKILQNLELNGEGFKEYEKRGVPVLSSLFPGGNRVNFLVLKDKAYTEEAMTIAEDMREADESVVIVSHNKVLSPAAQKSASFSGIVTWTSSQLDELLGLPHQTKEDQYNAVMPIMQSLRLADANRKTKVGPEAIVGVYIDSRDGKVLAKFSCVRSNYVLAIYGIVDLKQFTIESLQIPKTAQMQIRRGFAPIGTEPAMVGFVKESLERGMIAPDGYRPAEGVFVEDGVLHRDE